MPISLEERIHQAADTLLTYNKDPFIEDFLRKGPIPVTTPLGVLKALLPSSLQGTHPDYRIKIEDLVEYLDRLQQSGRQCVFLFRRSDSLPHDRLDLLRKEECIRDLLDQHKQGDIFNFNTYVWDANVPVLVEVRHTPQLLTCKWVETRFWSEMMAPQVDPESRSTTRRWSPREERSVNFFRMHLSTGDSELLIQKPHENAAKGLREELGIYLKLVRDLLGFDPGAPIVLESAMRGVLTGSNLNLRVKTWKVAQPGGGKLSGSGDPSLFASLRLRFTPFVPLYLEYVEDKGKIRVKMDGRKDYLEIATPCLPEQHEGILTRVREIASEQIRDPDLRKVASDHPELKIAVKKIDLHISQLKETKIRSQELVEEEWRDREQMISTMENARKLKPTKFRTTYYVQDPKTRKRYPDKDDLEYKDRASIPVEIEFREDDQFGKVPSAGNIWATLYVSAPAPAHFRDGLLRMVLEKLHRSDLIERAGNTLLGFFLLVFTLCYAVLSKWILGFIVTIFRGYPVLMYITFVFALIVLVALYISVVGAKTFKVARDRVFMNERLLAFGFGVVFVIVMLVIAIWIPHPTITQWFIFRVVLALAAGGVGALIPGLIRVQAGPYVRAGGALALFVLVFWFNPPKLVATPQQQGGEKDELVIPVLHQNAVLPDAYKISDIAAPSGIVVARRL